MQRTFLRGLLICLVPCLVAGYFALRGQYKLGIDLAGGTILVYEINLERSQERKKTEAGGDAAPAARPGARTEGLSSDEMQRLAAAIKRRIDPADLKNVTVRPLGDNRVEVILPRSGAKGGKVDNTDEDIDEVKRLISQVGVLEFRILANETDDKDGIADARRIIDNPTTEEQAAIDTARDRGRPPPAPPGEYTVTVNDVEARVRYAWAELGKEERNSLGLANANEGKGELWGQLAAVRGKTFVRVMNGVGEKRDKRATMVLYSRPTGADEIKREADEKAALQRTGRADLVDEKKIDYFVLTRVSPVDTLKVGGDITLTANATNDNRTFERAVEFRLNGPGGQQFGRISARNIPDNKTNTARILAILLDDRVVQAPSLNGPISSQGQITGGFDEKGVTRLVTILRSGALTAELRDKPVSENTMGPTLGADTIARGKLAVGLAFVAILAFMLIYYRFAGLVACVALFANLLLTVGFMVGVNAAFTLPGLAGIVLMLGMAVDANVLIYERLREERSKGANLITSIRNGYDRAFPTIIDTHLSSIFTAVVLYTFGNDQLKGFSISLTVGLVISLFTSLFMTRLMFDFWLRKGWLKQLKMMRLFERPRIDFMGIRYTMFTITAVLTVIGLGLFLYRGNKVLNVDFTQGTAYGGRLKDGEERALLKVGDKLGLRDMIDAPHQAERLKATAARWLNEPVGDAPLRDKKAAVNEYIYEITYADGKAATVSLAAAPAGETPEAMAADVIARASHLPDASVEQLYISGENYPDGKSRYFTVRTTEVEKELVQVTLDRLLRDQNGNALLPIPGMTYGPVKDGKVTLTFTEETSPNYLRDLLDRSFRLARADADAGASSFELTGVPTGTEAEQGRQQKERRFKEMVLDVSKNPKFAALRARDEAAAKKAEADARRAAATAAAPVLGALALATLPADDATAAALNDPAAAAEAKTLTDDVLAKTKATFESRPAPERLETFDSQLASETRVKAGLAIFFSWLAILLYLWFRFGNWTFGAAAVICLVHDLCFTLGAIAVCHYLYDTPFGPLLGLHDFKIDLPTVAALLTLVGYSVNDTIVVFDRIREVRGKNPALTVQMINDSINQTLSRTVLASLTVFLVVGVLYLFGGEGIHLFSFVMVVGVIVGTYSSIYVASPLLLLFGEGHTPVPAGGKREVAKV